MMAATTSPSRSTLPYPVGSRITADNTVAAFAESAWVSSTDCRVTGDSNGISTGTTSTVGTASVKPARPALTASPVPSCGSWRMWAISPGRAAITASAPSPTTTTVSRACSGAVLSRVHPSRLRPAAAWSALGRSDFIRVPLPAASTRTPSVMGVVSDIAGGTGLEPVLDGPKPPVLPVTPPPRGARKG